MYTSIMQNFVKKLIENEFRLSQTFHTETIKENSVVILLKEESPILYLVSLVNGQTIDLQNYEVFMNKYLQHLQKSLKAYHCSNIITLTIIAGEFLGEPEFVDIKKVIDFVNKQELILEGNCFHTWWYLSEARKTIEMNKSQAKDILHIRQIALDSLEESEQNYNSLDDILQMKQKSAFCLKSNNTLFTWILLCINFFIFFCMILLRKREIYILSFGAEYQAIFNMHEYYRLITCCFIHTNVIHLIQNSVYLYFFGMRTELLYGKMHMTMIYFFSALGGSLLSAYCNDAISVGASGAIFGLIGAVWIYSYKHGKKSVGMNYTTLLMLVIVALLAGVLQQNVDYFGHFGGFIAGSLLSFMILKWEKI